MCGIVGFFGSGDAADLARLTQLLAHRGPDGEGQFIDEHRQIFLGHRRLAIRDISGGGQPMHSLDERFVIVYNGELYNDRQLRQELESVGHRFVSESDTEVLLHALIEWKAEALARLDGQFALCFVNLESRDVIIARDRFGEKPLYWSQQSEGILFCSESSVLAQHPWVTPSLDENTCAQYLLLGYLPPPLSILRGVQQVRPGHALCFNTQQPDEIREFEFARPWENWKLNLSEESSGCSFGTEVIQAAVTSRRVSDVPAGVLLSGGVDSSLLVSSAVRADWWPPSFTIGFNEKSFDESTSASEIAAQIGIENTVRVLDGWSDDRVISLLQTLDEPLGDSSYLPTYEVFALASTKTKVLLTGDGGDELFFGYEPFRAFRFSQIFDRWLPPIFVRIIKRLIRIVPRSSSYMNRIEVTERFIDGLSYPSLLRVIVWMSTLRTFELEKFFVNKPHLETLVGDFASFDSGEDDLSTIRRYFLGSYLPGSIFAKSDTASMANSVESRTIFLHPSIVRYALSRRGRDEVSRRFGKLSLRQLAQDMGLRSVATRKKHGFAMPIAGILKNTRIPSPQVRMSAVNQSAVDHAWSAAQSGSTRHASFLWAALALVNSRSFRLATSEVNSER